MNIRTKKKIILTVALVIAVVALLVCYFAFLAPQGTAGHKEITLKVVFNDPAFKDLSLELNTKIVEGKTAADTFSLIEVLKSIDAKKLVIKTEDSTYGEFIVGVGGRVSDAKNNEFWEILVNGEAATVGASQLFIEDGKTYTLQLSKW